MQIPLKWINELVNIKEIPLDNLIKKLTLGGFEVEEILEIEENNQKQIVLDISATANRYDSLSIQGFALEIATLLKKSLQSDSYLIKKTDWKKNLQKKITFSSKNQKYSTFLTLTVKNIDQCKTPKWIKKKLQNSGILPMDTLEDFKKYILLETGYPFEFYDLKKISSTTKSSDFTLTITNALKNQNFIASNQSFYELDKSISIVNANNIPISLAGFIESDNFVVSETTNTLLIEGSIFNGTKIRQQSRKLGLRTERSSRYEKSLRTTYLIEAFYRLICLLRITNPNLKCKLHTAKKTFEKIKLPIRLRYKAIHEIVGPTNFSTNHSLIYLNTKEITNYLIRLNFQFTYQESKNQWFVLIPHARFDDINREIDLIEEIGRIHGFNKFLTTLPGIRAIGKEDSNYKIRKKITTSLLNLGLNELIHFSLVNHKTFLTNEINVVNPLLNDCSTLRLSLLPNLIKTVHINFNQKNIPIEGFEYGHIFSYNSNRKFIEKEYVGGIFGGGKTKLAWSDKATPLTWFEAKGKIEQLFIQLNLSVVWKKFSKQKIQNIFHPYRSAAIYLLDKKFLGRFGQIHPILASQLNIDSNLYLFEFDLEKIKFQFKTNKLSIYKSYSSYPKIIKDLSFIIKKDIEFKEIQTVLYWNGTKLLAEINLLDEYMGKPIPDNCKSLCLQLLFQSSTETLKNKKIDIIIKNLQYILTTKFKAKIRN